MTTAPASLPTRESPLAIAKQADLRTFVCVLVVGAGFDAFVRNGPATLGGALIAFGVLAVLALTGRFTSWQALGALALAALLVPFLALRTSLWLLPLDVLFACGLLFIAGIAQRIDLFNLSPGHALQQVLIAVGHHLSAGVFVARVLDTSALRKTQALAPVLRGVLLAVPLLLVLGALLASADTVFASIFEVDFSPENAVGHFILLTIGALLAAGVVRTASSKAPSPLNSSVALGAVETTVLLGSIVALFSAFVTAQLVALSGGADHVLETAGLTYAAYARAGFFQLVVVALITIVLITVLRTTIHSQSVKAQTRFRFLSLALLTLTFLMVLSALRKLDLYENAFGWTMLRLTATAFAAWVGVVLLLLGATLAGVAQRKEWFLGATLLSAWAALVVFNAINPEAVVMRSAIARWEKGEKFVINADELGAWSSDGINVLYDEAPSAVSPVRLDTDCYEINDHRSIWRYNLSDTKLRESLEQQCSKK